MQQQPQSQSQSQGQNQAAAPPPPPPPQQPHPQSNTAQSHSHGHPPPPPPASQPHAGPQSMAQAQTQAQTHSQPGYVHPHHAGQPPPGSVGPSTASGAQPVNQQGSQQGQEYKLVLELLNPDHREQALLELSKKREAYPDLAPVLWHSCGTIATLLQEIVSIYPQLLPPTLSHQASNRVCNALALLQCIASHPETRSSFLSANIPLYLYPFLNTSNKSRPFEYLRLTSLGVIGALVKMDDTEVIHFLLQTEIIPLCLKIMESGNDLSKTVATFIVQKILLDETGLEHICATSERFYAVSNVLSKMVTTLKEERSARLLKHIVRCYLRLSENPRAREALKQCLPAALKDGTFENDLKEDPVTKRWLQQL